MNRIPSARGVLGAAVLLATLVAAPPAAAQLVKPNAIIFYPICLTPDLATCQKDGYLASSCGKTYASTCKSLLQAEYQRQYDALTLSRSSQVPSNLSGGGAVTTVRVDPKSWAGYTASGMTATAQGEVLRSQATLLRTAGTIFAIDPRAKWRNDGARVGSCEELVFERYNSYGRFEDRAMGLGDDAWGIFFEAFYGDTAIAYQEVHDSTGGTIGPFTFASGLAPKNAFFEPLPTEYPPGVTGYSFAPDVLATIAAGKAYHPWSWSHHESLGWDTLGRYSEAELKSGYELARNHHEAIAQRRRIWDEYQKAVNQCGGDLYTRIACISSTNTQYGNLLYQQDQTLAFDFFFGRQAGCFNATGPSVCDWSPQLFWDQLQERINVVREPDYQLCKRLTRNDFKGGVVQQAVTAGIPGSGITAYDWPSTPQRFMLFLALLNSYLDGLDLPTDPATKKPSLQRFMSDNSNLGNDWFGASFSYDVGWGVTGMEGSGRVCNAQLLARGSFNASAKVLKSSIALVDTLAWLDTYTPDPVYNPNQTVLRTHAHLTVLNTSLYDSGWRETPLEFSIAANPSQSNSWTLVQTYIPVMGVPVKVTGGVSGVVGLNAGLGGYVQRDCGRNTIGFTVAGALKPYAQVDGFATASVDAAIIEVGIYGRLTLVRVELPLSLQVGTQVDGAGVLSLKAGTRLDLVLRTLDGRVGVFGRLLFASYEKDLITWTGVEQRTNLFQFDLDPPVSLLALDAALN